MASVSELEKAVKDAAAAQTAVVDTWVEKDQPNVETTPEGKELLVLYNDATTALTKLQTELTAAKAGVTTTNSLTVTTNTGSYASNADKNPVNHIGPGGATIAKSAAGGVKVYTAANTTLAIDIEGTPGSDAVTYGLTRSLVKGDLITKLQWNAILLTAEAEIVRRNKKVKTFTDVGGNTSTRNTGSRNFTVIDDTDTNWYLESDSIRSRYTYGYLYGLPVSSLGAAAALLEENYRVLPINVVHKEDIDYLLSKFEQTGYTNSISNINTSNSAKITATEFNQIVNKLKAAGQECICNCNYCTCNCNYACTCNCNYSDKQLKTEIIFL